MLISGASYTAGIIALMYVAERVDQPTVYLGHLVGVVVAFFLYLVDLLYHRIEQVRVGELVALTVLCFVWEVTLAMFIMGSFIPAPKSTTTDGSRVS